MIYILFIPVTLVILLFVLIYLIRYYDFKEIIFKLLAKKYKIKNIVYLKKIDIPEITKILSLNTKGKFIEYCIDTPAWYPIISIESADNEDWHIVKKNFMYFISKINVNPNKLSIIIFDKINDLLIQNIQIDSIWINKIVVYSFCQFIFDIKLTEDDMNLLSDGSIEWRKELAMKGIGNKIIKYKCVNKFKDFIKSNKLVYEIFKEDWYKSEYYSVIMQPFIISPMINISDIMVNYVELVQRKKISINEEITNEIINQVIYSSHPFPILERFDPATCTQYFIPLDSLTNYNNYNNHNKILVFGIGPRKCLGTNYAYSILKSFFTMYNKYPNSFLPKINHLYSGRNNDKFVLGEQLYMIKIIICLLIKKNNFSHMTN